MMEQLIGLTDTAYLGRVGEVELGASALAGVFYLIIFMLGFGFSIGAQILIARRNGEQNYMAIGPIFTQGSIFLFFMATVLFALSQIFSPMILREILSSPRVSEAADSYLEYRTYGFFFSYFATMFRAFYVGTTHTRILTVNSIAMVVTNIILNYILIFGKFGFPPMGIAGAAIASSISEAVSVFFFLLYTYCRTDWRKYDLFRFHGGIRPDILKQILGISIWTMIQEAFAFISWFVFFIAIEHLGERSLAITNIVRNVSAILFLFVNAFASTCSSLVGNLIGAGEADKVNDVCKRMTKLCFYFVIPLAILCAVFPYAVLQVYTDNTELIHASIPSLWVMLTTFIFCVPAFVYLFSTAGTGNTLITLYITIGSVTFYVPYTLYLVYIVHADVAVCWTSDHVYYLITFLAAYTYIHSKRWKKKII